jgi:Spy/CpxP family protein refolding chaperone
MRPKTRLIWAAPVALVLTLTWVALPTSAQPPWAGEGGPGPHGRGGMGFGKLETLAAELELTDDQKADVEKIREEGRSEGLALRKQMMRFRHKLHGQLLEDEPDRQAVLLLAEQIGDLRTKLEIHRIEQRLSIRAVLTPEQRDELMTLGPRHGRGGRCRHSRHFRGPDEMGPWER